MPKVLATYPSSSNPSKTYEITEGDDGVVYCTCPAWKFQNAKNLGRDCKHLIDWRAGGGSSVTQPTGGVQMPARKLTDAEIIAHKSDYKVQKGWDPTSQELARHIKTVAGITIDPSTLRGRMSAIKKGNSGVSINEYGKDAPITPPKYNQPKYSVGDKVCVKQMNKITNKVVSFGGITVQITDDQTNLGGTISEIKSLKPNNWDKFYRIKDSEDVWHEEWLEEYTPSAGGKRKIEVIAEPVMKELEMYIPQSSLFAAYVEREVDQELSVHLNLQAMGMDCKYPIAQGKQGTGKTMSYLFYAYQEQLPFFLFSCYEDMNIRKLFGDKTIENGTVKFQESLFVKAIQGPSMICIDEVNALGQAETYDLHALTQNRELFVKDANDGKGKVYKLHPQCRIGFAQNPKSRKYVGGNIRASNFLGRCTYITYPEFSIKELDVTLQKKYPELSKDERKSFIKFYRAVVDTIDKNDMPVDISIRQLTNVIDLWIHGVPLKKAIEQGIANITEAVSQPNSKGSIMSLAEQNWNELQMKNLMWYMMGGK